MSDILTIVRQLVILLAIACGLIRGGSILPVDRTPYPHHQAAQSVPIFIQTAFVLPQAGARAVPISSSYPEREYYHERL
jgi:hypothetical protein